MVKSKKFIRLTALFLTVAFASSLFGCKTQYVYDASLYAKDDDWNINKSVLNGIAFTEDKSVYKTDQDGFISHLYLTVQAGKNKEIDKTYSFGYLNTYTDGDLSPGEEPYCDVIMSEGTETSSHGITLFGFGETTANGKLTIKGNTEKIKTRSYQIKLYSRAGLWNGMRTINLYKNISDLSRMKQKLCFDALEKLPDIGSLRTGFVRLFVQDTTGERISGFEDLGIYTYIEQPNKSYLTSHGLDSDANLYKANRFDFSKNEALLDTEDENYDSKAFEKILRIREGSDHKKLLSVIDAVNDESIPVSALIGNYFNEDNLLTYAAVTILFSDMEAYNRNFLLYSTKNSQTWYLLPAGFSESFENKVGDGDEKIPSSLIGIGFLQNNVLFRRYFESQENINKLKVKIDEIRKIITKEYMEGQLLTYKKSILKYLYSVPEIRLLPRSAEYVLPYIDSLPGIYEENYQYFLENIKKPIPPYILTDIHDSENKTLTLKYLTAPSADDKKIMYHAEVSINPDFGTIVFSTESTDKGAIRIENIPDITYYVRIAAVDTDGNTQYSTNIVSDRKGDTFYGCIVSEREGI